MSTTLVSKESAVIEEIRMNFLTGLYSHALERIHRTLYWDLRWTMSCLETMSRFYIMTRGTRHPQLMELHELLGRFFDEAFPSNVRFRLNPERAVEVFRHAHDVAALEARTIVSESGRRSLKPLDEETLTFDLDGEGYSISIWDNYHSTRNAFDGAREPLQRLIARIGKPDDDVIHDPIKQADAVAWIMKELSRDDDDRNAQASIRMTLKRWADSEEIRREGKGGRDTWYSEGQLEDRLLNLKREGANKKNGEDFDPFNLS